MVLEQVEKYPELAEGFNKMTFLPLAGKTHLIPPGGNGIGILVDVLVAEVEGGGGDVHGLVGHVVGGRRSGEGARKRAFL